MFGRKRKREVWKDLVAGVAGGATGTLAMAGLDLLWRRLAADGSQAADEDVRQLGQRPGQHIASSRRSDVENDEGNAFSSRSQDGPDSATATVLRAVSRRALASDHTPSRRQRAGDHGAPRGLAHYGVDGGVGVVYGAVAEMWPTMTAGRGVAFGAGVAIVDNVILPALRPSRRARRFFSISHAYSLGSHLAYGACCEAVRRRVRAILD